MRSPSTVGVPRGPDPRSLVPDGPRAVDQISFPFDRLSARIVLRLSFIPCTNTRSPMTAIEPYPPPTFVADQTIGGPEGGHECSSPVSFDTPLRSGPCHCGQSPSDGCGWAIGEAATPRASTSVKTDRGVMEALLEEAGVEI